MSSPISADDELCDSRTASVGQQRNQTRRTPSSQSNASGNQPERKRTKRNGDSRGDNATSTNLKDSSSSSQGSDSGEDESHGKEDSGSSKTQLPSRGIQPAVRWNKGSKSTIRTKLGSRATSGTSTPNPSQVKADGEKGRSRSVSTSTTSTHAQNPLSREETRNSSNTILESGRNFHGEDARPHAMSISDGSESGEITEGDDDIVLNISFQREEAPIHESQREGAVFSENHILQEDQVNGHSTVANGSDRNHRPQPGSNHISTSPKEESSLRNMPSSHPDPAKEAAFRSLAGKYPTKPAVLADLSLDDLEIQSKYIFYKVDSIHDLDITLPIRCINCLKEGHLCEVCPDKECEHCGAWESHESRFCPSWRRCQKCRERGHDKRDCASRLIGTAMEVPCDLCGSSSHLENDCDMMWKTPWPNPLVGSVTVSISCSRCTSSQHLIGDCPGLRYPLGSSTWSLKAHDPSMINKPKPSPLPGGSGLIKAPVGGNRPGMRIRGRADPRSPSPESDDMRTAPRNPIRRDPPRSHIRFDPGIGRNNNWDDCDNPSSQRQDYNQYQSLEPRDHYRDREDFVGYNTRQRSLSPDPRPVHRRGRGGMNGDNRGSGENRRPPPRSPPHQQYRGRGQGQYPRARGRFAPRGGRGGKPGGGGPDAYRPLPGAGKKAWDKHRLG